MAESTLISEFSRYKDTQFGLRRECATGTLEDLLLFGDRMHHRLEEKTSLDHSEATGLHLRGDLLDVPPVVHPIETKSETPPGPLRDRTRSSRINSSGKCLLPATRPSSLRRLTSTWRKLHEVWSRRWTSLLVP
jgi:hypothetical protein